MKASLLNFKKNTIFRLVFVLGLPEDKTKQPIIDTEAQKFNDLIQGTVFLIL